MRVFVLNTGRCGSTTFARACEHLTNFTAGHESRTRLMDLGERLDYPDNHIEVDNRLTWFLAPLVERYPDAYWVHLTRDRSAVIDSFGRRKSPIIRAFGRGILMHRDEMTDQERARVAVMYVDTAIATIEAFLRDRDHMHVALETLDVDFVKFLDRIGAEGDLDAAMDEWGVRHNTSRY